MSVLIETVKGVGREATRGFIGGEATDDMLRVILEYVKPGMRTIETGSGYTTLAFLAAGAKHTAIDPQPGKIDALRRAARAGMLSADGAILAIYECSSRNQWGHTMTSSFRVDFALMDGLDVFPDCVIDVLYLAQLLKSGGHLLIDDVYQPGIQIAMEMLGHFGRFTPLPEVISGRSALYRKEKS